MAKGYSVWIVTQVEADSRDEASDLVAKRQLTDEGGTNHDFEIYNVEPWPDNG